MGEGWLGVKNKLYKSLDRLRTLAGSVAEAETTATDMATAAPRQRTGPYFHPPNASRRVRQLFHARHELLQGHNRVRANRGVAVAALADELQLQFNELY